MRDAASDAADSRDSWVRDILRDILQSKHSVEITRPSTCLDAVPVSARPPDGIGMRT